MKTLKAKLVRAGFEIKATDSLERVFEKAYEKDGADAVYDLANSPKYKDRIKEWKHCEQCDAETPRHPKTGICLVCGQ